MLKCSLAKRAAESCQFTRQLFCEKEIVHRVAKRETWWGADSQCRQSVELIGKGPAGPFFSLISRRLRWGVRTTQIRHELFPDLGSGVSVLLYGRLMTLMDSYTSLPSNTHGGVKRVMCMRSDMQ